MKKYLITGGCGFLGSNLASEVLRRGEMLCVYDNLSRRGGDANYAWLQGQGDFEFIRNDVRDADALAAAVVEFGPDVIFHLSGQVAMTTSIEDPRLDFETNALGTFNLLEAVRRHAPEAVVIYSSTNKVYGDLEWVSYREEETRYAAEGFPSGFDETTALSFHSPYGCSKGAADQYMLDYSRIFGLNTVVFRHSSMYGARQFSTYDQGWIGWFTQIAIDRKAGGNAPELVISGNGKQVRDVLHGDDMIRLYFQAVDHIADARGEAFNIGGGMDNSLSLLELFSLLARLTGTDLTVDQHLDPRPSDQKIFVADIGKAKRLLKWCPEVNAEDGIAQMLVWLEEQQK